MSGTPLALLDENTKIGNIQNELQTKITNSSLQQLIEVNIMPASMFEQGQPMSILKSYDANHDKTVAEDEGLNAITLSNLSIVLTSVISTSSVGELMDAQLLPISDKKASLDALFRLKLYNRYYEGMTPRAENERTSLGSENLDDLADSITNNGTVITTGDSGTARAFWRALTTSEFFDVLLSN